MATVKNFDKNGDKIVSPKATPSKVGSSVAKGMLFSPDKPQMTTKAVPSKTGTSVDKSVFNTNKNVVNTTPKGK